MRPSTYKKRPVAERLWRRVNRGNPDECWEWTGATNSEGYGTIGVGNSSTRKCHRVSWEASFGPIPSGMQVLHKCDNRRCCNPSHLFMGTNDDNIADCVSKHRTWYQRLWSLRALGATPAQTPKEGIDLS